MAMQRSHRARWALISCIFAGALIVGGAQAEEVQLAGMRLGQHGVNLLDIYGQPDGIVTGAGTEFGVGVAAAPGVAGMAPGMFEEGMPPEMFEGMMGAGMYEEDMMGAGMYEEGMPPEMFEGMGPGTFPGAEGVPGVPGVGPAAAAGVQRGTYPLWALPVWVTLEPNDIEWLYRRDDVVLGFVLDRDGYIKVIAVAARECNFARTALWRPHQYIKLGDSYQRVIYRYGWPEETRTYYSTGPGEVGVGGGSVSVTFSGSTRQFTRDSILRYHETSNIAFTLHNMKVVRIHIWSNE